LPQQIVQAVHAAHEAGIHFAHQSNNTSSVVVCEVPSEQDLLFALDSLTQKGIRCVLFREPDIGNEATALASEPIFGKHRHIFRKFKLWGKGGTNA